MKEATCSKCREIYNPDQFGELHYSNDCNGSPINEGEYDEIKYQERGYKMTEEYNGWTNRESWATKLHLDNDQALNESAWEYAREEAAGHDKGEEINAYHLGQTLKNWIEEDLLTLENISGNRDLWLMLTDIGSLYRVNWREIAQAYLDEIAIELENAL